MIRFQYAEQQLVTTVSKKYRVIGTTSLNQIKTSCKDWIHSTLFVLSKRNCKKRQTVSGVGGGLLPETESFD